MVVGVIAANYTSNDFVYDHNNVAESRSKRTMNFAENIPAIEPSFGCCVIQIANVLVPMVSSVRFTISWMKVKVTIWYGGYAVRTTAERLLW